MREVHNVQDRPYIFCHMMTSLDGKIIGPYMETPEGEAAGEAFHRIAFGDAPYYRHQGWLSGRVTTDDNFTDYRVPVLDETAPPVPEGDFVAVPDAPMYYVSVDPSGRLGWESATLRYEEVSAHVVEVLTGRVSNAYKSFLRGLGISYIIAGADELDIPLALGKMKRLFGVSTLMLGGGGVLNWSFIQAGMCDEISIVMAAAADGSSGSPTLFETRGGHASSQGIGFILQEATVLDGGSVWLRYLVNHTGKKPDGSLSRRAAVHSVDPNKEHR
ncbi:MAG: RibD family protein [Planctomycetaceae bacterium]|nr:RibD family protein [Planctomycetaceae bacterium]